MEAAPLTAAHVHVRNASKKPTAAAIEEHRQAADGFAAAASDVHDAEALRMLRLLEEHHRRLARIVESPITPEKTATSESKSPSLPPSSKLNSQLNPAVLDAAPPNALPQHQVSTPPTTLQAKTHREHSTSIANSLATARGINRNQQRRNPATSSPPPYSGKAPAGNIRGTHTEVGKPHTPQLVQGDSLWRDTTDDGSRNTTAEALRSTDPDQAQRQRLEETPTSPSSPSEDSFSKFYATLGDILSKVSAPLAFAGLPLGPEDSKSAGPESPKSKAADGQVSKDHSHRHQPGNDIEKLFSKATLRAIRADGNDTIPAPIIGGGVHDSFYHVPHGSILSRAEQTARQQSDNSHHNRQNSTNDEFVDARETPQPGSPTHLRLQSPDRPRKFANKKTDEELALENETLRQLSDTLSKRLYMWETSAQNQSEALQASRMLRANPSSVSMAGQTITSPLPITQDANHPDHTAAIKELESQLEAAQHDMEKVGRENDKLRAVVARYRERWEKLKEGARVRRESVNGSAVTPEKT